MATHEYSTSPEFPNPTSLKRCSRCETFKSREDLCKGSWCKVCSALWARDYRKKHPEREKLSSKKSREKHPGAWKAYADTHPTIMKAIRQRGMTKHRDRRLAKKRESSALHYAENREKESIRKKVSYQKNRERILSRERERKHKLRSENPTKLREQERGRNQRHRTKHRDRINISQRLSEHRRRARVLGLPNTFGHQDEAFALKYWEQACAICGTVNDFWYALALDHWYPLCGKDCPGTIPQNIIPLCHGRKGCNNSDRKRACNQSKRNKNPFAWLYQFFVELYGPQLGIRKAKKKLEDIEIFFQAVKERNALCTEK